MALEAVSVVGDVTVSKTLSPSTGGPEWLVTFMNNAGNLPELVADSSAMWGGVTVSVNEEREGTSETVSGSFELGISGSTSGRVAVSHDVTAAEVNVVHSL